MLARILLGLLCGAILCAGADSTSQANPAGNLSLLLPPQLRGADPNYKFKSSLFFALDEGQAVKGVYDHDSSAMLTGSPYTPFNRVWQQKMELYLSEELSYKERLRFIVSIQCDLLFSMVQRQEFPATGRPEFSFFPNDVEVQYRFGDPDRPWLQLSAGYFPFKYNPDARNLGEFLLRSEAYPTIIMTDFEKPYTHELGLRLNGTFDWLFKNPSVDRLAWDIMLTSEMQDYPLMDGTLTGIIANDFYNFISIGAGVSFQRLFSVDETKTTPKNNALYPKGNSYFDENGDTKYYTFASTKLMGRASISPLRFVPEFKIPPGFIFGKKPFFGKEDLKIYGEAAVLGTKNFIAYGNFQKDTVYDTINGIPLPTERNKPGTGTPAPDTLNYYNSTKDRTPLMLGVNLPTNPIISYGILPFVLTKWLKDETGSDIRSLAWVTLVPALASGVAEQFLGWDLGPDVLSMEFEWFSQRFPNSNQFALNPDDKVPVPFPNYYRVEANFGKPEPTKYSLYFKKTFYKRFALSGQVARDHMRPVSFVPPTINQTDDFLQTKEQWWWTVRLSANF